ncbi:hypothetical protein DSO57_1005356 [Entomophthora muscae]|uniref:Uncharacterized protein n=1 Tax=Entomophthora muscae TaxID=34485 RepID=A0ACC2RMZ9_9FUNG|nr:hypothetical protein DSO57_1005356 [Entomophthora muscae]
MSQSPASVQDIIKCIVGALGGATSFQEKHTKSGPRRLRVLIVDDNYLYIRILSKTLERYCRHEISVVCQALGPDEALVQLAIQEFDLIFMDIDMPNLTGVELTNIIRSNTSKSAIIHSNRAIPIIACTTNCLPTDIAIYLDAGMDGYVAKPFTHSQIAEVVQKTLYTNERIPLQI